ncbi:MAG: hypothetical protein WCX31_07155 [Salinivirgaceae bacterium]
MKKLICLFAFIGIAAQPFAQQSKQEINPRFLKSYWDASWITHPTADLKAYGVYHF